MRELTHRAKNLLTVIQSIARRMARTAPSVEEFENRLGQRLQGLAASQDVLVANNWQGAPLADLIRQQLEPFIEASRVQVAGPEIVVRAEGAQAVGLAIHELATNAIKYGALSRDTGDVAISWKFESGTDESRHLTLSWIEQGGPPVAAPLKRGFGHLVTGEIIERYLNAKVTADFAVHGLNWRVTMPMTNLVQ
jgi:two-component system CheB/CheR fusion protein